MMTRTIAQIARDAATQDNECTANPQFVVQKQVRIWGIGLDYTEDHAWIAHENDHEQADAETAKKLDCMRDETFYDELELKDEDGYTVKWTRVGYCDQWVFVTACMTRAGCEEYLRLNGHNLGKTRIFVEGEVRNKEWATLRQHLLRVPHVHDAMRAVATAYTDGDTDRLGEAIGAMMAIITHLDGHVP